MQPLDENLESSPEVMGFIVKSQHLELNSSIQPSQHMPKHTEA